MATVCASPGTDTDVKTSLMGAAFWAKAAGEATRARARRISAVLFMRTSLKK
jgi:hypothetical protein